MSATNGVGVVSSQSMTGGSKMSIISAQTNASLNFS